MSERHINLIDEDLDPRLLRGSRGSLERAKGGQGAVGGVKKIRLIYRLFIVVLAVLVFFFTNAIFSHNSLVSNLGRLSFWEGVARLMTGKDKILKGELTDRINILILGMGGAEHEGPYLTDTIILASLKPSTNQLALLSIPRDLYVPVPDYGWRKINSANALGMIKSNDGGALTSQVVEDILDLNIHYWARVDFDIFKSLIDELGGIEINIKSSFVDYQFPGPNFSYRVVSFEAGRQEMDGEKALQFVRSRHGNNNEGSDFARAQRQQKVLFAIKQKIEQENILSQPQKIWRFFNILKDNISTNLDISQGIKLAKLVSTIKEGDIIARIIDQGENGLVRAEINIDGSYILKPKKENFKDLAKLAREMLEQSPAQDQIVFGSQVSGLVKPAPPVNESMYFKEPKILILNGTYIPGLAEQTSQKLKNIGFAVVKIGNAPIRNYNKTIIYNVSNRSDLLNTLHDLKTLVKAEIGQELSEQLKNILLSNQADFLIILGKE